MKNVIALLMFALVGFAVMANHNHDGKKGKKSKAQKQCCAAAHAAATDGAVPACCQAKAGKGKQCAGAAGAEAPKACPGHAGKAGGGHHQHDAAPAQKAQ